MPISKPHPSPALTQPEGLSRVLLPSRVQLRTQAGLARRRLLQQHAQRLLPGGGRGGWGGWGGHLRAVAACRARPRGRCCHHWCALLRRLASIAKPWGTASIQLHCKFATSPPPHLPLAFQQHQRAAQRPPPNFPSINPQRDISHPPLRRLPELSRRPDCGHLVAPRVALRHLKRLRRVVRRRARRGDLCLRRRLHWHWVFSGVELELTASPR